MPPSALQHLHMDPVDPVPYEATHAMLGELTERAHRLANALRNGVVDLANTTMSFTGTLTDINNAGQVVGSSRPAFSNMSLR